ncbi:MAG: hypothetical protein C0448_04335 [Sphingobacteriaceae bacterium]|nr:hypothetical protein [Sphingobacteriaceae bacterium]
MKLCKTIFIITTAIVFAACTPKFNEPDLSTGSINASDYLAIGGSMTAGYSDGALYDEGQRNSYANLLATQLKNLGVGATIFKIPYAQSSIGMGNANNARSILGNRTDCQNVVSLGPVKIASQGDINVFSNNVYNSQGPFHNFGVPDLKSIEIDINGYSNPFYQRMASSGTSSVLYDAISRNPTFFSLNLGLHDVLKYALKGGASDNITPVSGPIGFGFEASINNVIEKLTANGAKGVIANIPSIKSMAYFNTIAWNALKLDSLTAANLNLYYGALSAPFSFSVGNNGFIIQDTSQFLGFRQAQEDEFILLNVPLDSVKCYKWGSLIPIPDRYVLTASEINNIENAINDYNTVLKNISETKGLAYVDVHSLFNKVKNGFIYNGVTINASFVSGGFYSLDGLNLTPRGNAFLANEFIKSINDKYHAIIPQLDAMKYPGVIFP